MRAFVKYSTCSLLLPLLLRIGSPNVAEMQNLSQQVSVDYRLPETVSLHEPVVLNFVVRNNLSEPIILALGSENIQFFKFTLAMPDHETASSFQSHGANAAVTVVGTGEIVVPPGEVYSQQIVMNRWFSFSTPGKYVLSGQLSTPIKVGGGPALPIQLGKAEITVLERNTNRLEALCQSLVDRIFTAKSVEAEQGPALELSYVNDPIAVPYLAQALRRHILNYNLAVSGLESIGDDAAIEVLLSAMNDTYGDIGELSRRALTRLEPRILKPNLREAVKHALEKAASNQAPKLELGWPTVDTPGSY